MKLPLRIKMLLMGLKETALRVTYTLARAMMYLSAPS